jgi:hypothetical protein
VEDEAAVALMLDDMLPRPAQLSWALLLMLRQLLR